ncbi:gb [Venturia nashicola]|uniref:Gb n=1 Tax=Venturia nashicola TaxID=86259 RepID=A0A4Z1PK84_9PEZI|nr:gb [Venturia nashicola]TLD38162.1 gb [Venturia nashicola]
MSFPPNQQQPWNGIGSSRPMTEQGQMAPMNPFSQQQYTMPLAPIGQQQMIPIPPNGQQMGINQGTGQQMVPFQPNGQQMGTYQPNEQGMGGYQPYGQQMVPLQPAMPPPPRPRVVQPQQLSNEEIQARRLLSAFMAEQSTVVILSSVPADVFQEDIHDFMATAGVRPVSLWTLMPRNGMRYDIAFVTFATHRQATRSLSLDGHFLPTTMSRIRVSPSSPRVLQRGNGVTTPFPVRQDWWCHGCRFRNPARNNNCERCALPRIVAQHPNNFGGNQPRQGSGGGNAPGLGGGFVGDNAFGGGSGGKNAFGGGSGGNNTFGRGAGNAPNMSGGYPGAGGSY